jgi:hypothetical protein
MANIQINEVRTVKYVGGVQTFEIFVTCTGKGDLPHTGIFVHRILDSRNSLDDEFQRVANVADITTYEADRDEANRLHAEYWLSSTVTLTYTEIEVADQAVRILSDRVNTLATDWETYQASFDTHEEYPDGRDYTFPTGDVTYIEEVKADYATAVSDYDTAVDTFATATADYDDSVTALAAANSELSNWTAQYNLIHGGGGEAGIYPQFLFANTKFDVLCDDGGTIISSINTFLSALDQIILAPNSGSYLVRLTMNPAEAYTSPGANSIGKTVTSSGGATGVLHYYQDSTKEWWVTKEAGSFAAPQTVSVPGGGAGTIGAVLRYTPVPYYSIYETLKAAKVSFVEVLNEAEIASSQIANGLTYCEGAATATQLIVQDKQDSVSTAQSAVDEKKKTQLDATAAVKAAYDAVIAAYDKVKEVCPDWSPDPPLPAQP